MIAWMLLAFVPGPCIVDSVEITELNRIYNPETGAEHQRYWLWWRLYEDGNYHIADWRTAEGMPYPVNGVHEFWDKKAKANRRIESRVVMESHVFFDREVEDRKTWPDVKRRKLTNAPRDRGPVERPNP